MTIKSEFKKAALSTLLTAALTVGTIQTYKWCDPVYKRIAHREEQAPINEKENVGTIYNAFLCADYYLRFIPAGGSLLYGSDSHFPSTDKALNSLERMRELIGNPLTPSPLRQNLENITQDVISKLNQNSSIYDSHGHFNQFFSEREELLNASNQCEDYMEKYDKEIKTIPTINYIGKWSMSLLIIGLGFSTLIAGMFSAIHISEFHYDLNEAIKMYDDKNK